MKTSETSKELYSKTNALLGEIDSTIKAELKKIKKEYEQLLTETKINTIKQVCEIGNLNFIEIRNKILTEKEKKSIIIVPEVKEVSNEELLDTITIDNKTYYYENKEKGSIFNKDSKQVGIFKNGKATLY